MDLTGPQRAKYGFLRELKHASINGNATFAINQLINRLPAGEQKEFLLQTLNNPERAMTELEKPELVQELRERGIKQPENQRELQRAALAALHSRFGMDNIATLVQLICE